MQSVVKSFKELAWYWQALGAGLCLGVGFLSVWTAPLTLVGIVWGIWYLKNYIASTRQAWCFGWLWWSIKFGIVLSFFLHTYPVEWLAGTVSSPFQILFIGMSWFLASITLGLAGGLVSCLIYKIHRFSLPKYIVIPTVALSWVLGEVLGSLFFALLTLGPGTSLAPTFGIGYVGQALVALPIFVPFAVLGGVYAVSFFTVVIANMLQIIGRAKWWFVFVPIVKITLVNVALSWYMTYEPQNVSIVTIDTEFSDSASPEMRSVVWQEVMTKIVELELETDYIILPEDSRYSRYHLRATTSPDYLLAQMRLRSDNAIIIDSATTPQSGSRYVLRGSFLQGGAAVALQDKQYLTPQGEALPYVMWYFLRAIGQAEWLSDDGWGRMVPGEYQYVTPHSSSYEKNLPSLLFCFESLTPWSVWAQVRQSQASFVVHPVSHATFQNAPFLSHQLNMLLRMQAVFNRVSIVSAGNMATGTVYYPDGRIEFVPIIKTGEGWRVGQISL